MKHRILPGALLAVALAVPVLAQAPAVDSVFKDFTRTGEYLLMVNGKPVPA